MTTQEAFKQLIHTRGIYRVLEVDRATVSNWRKLFAQGKGITLDQMEKLLKKAGWEKKPESWSKKL